MFTTIATLPRGLEAPQVVSLRILPELQKISIVVRTGDIIMVSIDESGAVCIRDLPSKNVPGLLSFRRSRSKGPWNQGYWQHLGARMTHSSPLLQVSRPGGGMTQTPTDS